MLYYFIDKLKMNANVTDLAPSWSLKMIATDIDLHKFSRT